MPRVLRPIGGPPGPRAACRISGSALVCRSVVQRQAREAPAFWEARMARVAVVTGGTRGIGGAISGALKKAGHKVAAVYAGNDGAAAPFTNETCIPPFNFDLSAFNSS